MNRIWCFFLAVLISLPCLKAAEIGRPYEVDTVIQVPNVTAAQIYAGAKAWIATAVVDAKSVIQLDDPTNNHLIGKSNLRLQVNHMMYSSLTGHIEFVIDIQARDGRMRVKLYGFDHKADHSPGPYNWDMGPVYVDGERPDAPKKSYKEMQKRALPLISENVTMILDGLKSKASVSTSEDDNW